MYARTHLVVALFLSLVFLHSAGGVVFLSATLFFALFPDVDSQNSWIGKKKIFKPVRFFTKHRGVLHSSSFMLFLGIIIYFLFPSVFEGFLLGYGSHLILDSLTPRGIKLFWPLDLRLKGRFRTGGGVEIFIFVAFIILDVTFVLTHILF
ncbi:hypothetical protein B6U91_01705 [Candidatus Pacearchaeota archaeon ex4484_71]|nr:MAG: hypothetical protein B6U91_01705 [Candidatus Pacearchaeota archaeon ex4484_71]